MTLMIAIATLLLMKINRVIIATAIATATATATATVAAVILTIAEVKVT